MTDRSHHGMLIMDATAVPQDMTYPADVGLLNKAREKLEGLIDELWQAEPGAIKPRTYRRQSRKQYLAFSRKRNPRRKTIRKALRKQLSYVRRDIQHMLDGYTGIVRTELTLNLWGLKCMVDQPWADLQRPKHRRRKNTISWNRSNGTGLKLIAQLLLPIYSKSLKPAF